MKNSEKILSISAIIIALVSIIISVWQGIESRHHNRLAVRPRLDISYFVSKNSFGFKLKNNGLGPAILHSRAIIVNGKEYKWYKKDILFEINKNFGFSENMSFSLLPINSTIPQGTTIDLILFRSPKTKGMNAKKIIFKNFSFKYEYKSMYDEIFTSYSSNYIK